MDVVVRYKEKNATIRYLPGKVRLEQIMKQYDDTPFEVAPEGPIVSISRSKQVTLRGWTRRIDSSQPAAKADPARKPIAKATNKATNNQKPPLPIQLIVELVPTASQRFDMPPQLSLADPPAAGLAVADAFQKVELAKTPADDDKDQPANKSRATRFVARLTQSVTLAPGELIVPVEFQAKTTGGDQQESVTGRLDVVLRTVGSKPKPSLVASSGVARIGGTLELRLGHLCDQQGCVDHFHNSLGEIAGLAGVRPHPSLKEPRATAYLRAGQAVDVWGLREKLRDQGVEVTAIEPRHLDAYRLRIELSRWHPDDKSTDVLQCMACRDRTNEVAGKLSWVDNVNVAGGGINFAPTAKDVDLVELLNALDNSGAAPLAVWLVPAGVPMPKPPPPRVTQPRGTPKQTGSQFNPLVEFEFRHSSEIGTDISTLLAQQKWASLTGIESDATQIARLNIADRKYANLTPLLRGLRSTGRIPNQIRLREFGDIRVQIEFVHICGNVDYSKPPKPKKKKKKPMPKDAAKADAKKEDTKKADAKKADAKKKADVKPKKPFVSKALRPSSTSNGRKAVEKAIANVSWIKDAVIHDYHTKPNFNGPRKLMFAMQAKRDDMVRLDELIQALRAAGFPPKSVIVSRRFPGIPFGNPLPNDLNLTDGQGNQRLLASLKKADRPLAIAFISLKCPPPKFKKYKADPKYFGIFKQTVDKYQDRIDFLAVSANKADKFDDVTKFWQSTAAAAVPLLHDSDGKVRGAFNAHATPAPHIYVFDAAGRLRYAGDAHDSWEAPEKSKDNYLDKALELVLAGKYLDNGAVFYNKSVCNCSHPKCKCPKCGCGSTCRCGIGKCGIGF